MTEAAWFVGAARSVIDEGVYLNAGRLVFEGALPYRDFPFSQGPLVPYVYGAALEGFGVSVVVGRWLSFALGALGFAATLWVAWTLGGRLATTVFAVLSMANLPALWVATTVRTQSLSTPLTLLGLAALALPRRGPLSWAVSPSLLLWSTGARLTNVLAFLAVCGWVAVRLRDQPKRLAGVAAIVAAQALVLFAPVLVALNDAIFHIVTAQLGRGDRAGARETSLFEGLYAKFMVFLAPETSFVAILALTGVVVIGLVARARRGWRPDLARPLEDAGTAQLVTIVLAVLVFLPHLLLNRGFLTYFVTSSSLLVLAIAIGVAEIARESGRGSRLAAVAAAGLVALGVALVPAHWSAWIGSGPSSFPHFREVAREVRSRAGDSCTMVTMETALAVEAGCRVLPGLEYSMFSYFPGLSDEEAARRGVVNQDLLVARVRDLRPELIVLGPRGRSSLRLGAGKGAPPSPGFLAPRGYTFSARHRISSGAHVRVAPDSVAVDVFVRDDLARRAPATLDELP